MCFFLFTASFERRIENPRLFLCCLPLPSSSCVSSLLPSIFPVLLYLPLSFLDVRCVHIQHSPFSLSLSLALPSTRLSLHHYLCFCCAVLLGIQRYHHFRALFFSFSPSLRLRATSSNPLSLSNDSVLPAVKWTQL